MLKQILQTWLSKIGLHGLVPQQEGRGSFIKLCESFQAGLSIRIKHHQINCLS